MKIAVFCSANFLIRNNPGLVNHTSRIYVVNPYGNNLWESLIPWNEM